MDINILNKALPQIATYLKKGEKIQLEYDNTKKGIKLLQIKTKLIK